MRGDATKRAMIIVNGTYFELIIQKSVIDCLIISRYDLEVCTENVNAVAVEEVVYGFAFHQNIKKRKFFTKKSEPKMIGITYADLFLNRKNGLVEFLKYEIY